MFLFFFKGMNDVFNIKVWCFQQLSNVLKAAGEKKVKEVQICLEGSYNYNFYVVLKLTIYTGNFAMRITM